MSSILDDIVTWRKVRVLICLVPNFTRRFKMYSIHALTGPILIYGNRYQIKPSMNQRQVIVPVSQDQNLRAIWRSNFISFIFSEYVSEIEILI